MAVANTRRSPLLLAAAFLALALAAAGCLAETPSPTPAPTGVLLSVEIRGGLCAPGTCGATILVERDGRVHQAAKPPSDLGVVSPAALAALGEAIRTTDFTALRSRPFSGTCPTAYDGREVVFEFAAPSGVERIATCEVEIDYSAPLFLAVANAVGPFISLPTAGG